MKTFTWIKGTDKYLDDIFEECRLIRYNDKSHRYWQNYSSEDFSSSVAFTICFNDNDIPEMCATVAARSCWPAGAYRILNRLWKHSNKISYPKLMSTSFTETAKSQVNWIKENTDFQLYFISRQTNNWEDWVIKNFKYYGLEFIKDNHFYLTCNNESDHTCWQKIIYSGNDELLKQWKRKL